MPFKIKNTKIKCFPKKIFPYFKDSFENEAACNLYNKIVQVNR